MQAKLILILVVKIPFKTLEKNIPTFIEDKDGNTKLLQPERPPAQQLEPEVLEVNKETVLPEQLDK